MVTSVITGLELAVQLLADNTNDWGGSDPAEAIATSAYAVVVERDDDAWVKAADRLGDVADIELSTLVGTEGYDEWVSEVWDVATGEQVAYTRLVAVHLLDTAGRPLASVSS